MLFRSDCIQCHAAKPADILSPGHWIVGDTTPGIPEILFANGLNAGGAFGGSGTGTCTQSYCHGNGRGKNGTVKHTDPTPTCKTCHGYTGATAGMSGHHGGHVGGGIGGTCYDCHSNNTRYPWYAEVQPAAWWLAGHIRDGKDHLNFSEFGSYPAKRAARKLEQCGEQIEEDSMPLASYRLIHRDARFNPEQKKRIIEWLDALQEQIKTSKE